jgi:hypothetical protein
MAQQGQREGGMARGLGRQRSRRRGGDLPAGMRGAGRRRRGRAGQQHHRRALRPGERQAARGREIQQRLASMKLDQHGRGGAVAHAVEPGAQQRLAVLEHQQRHRIGIEPQLDQARTIGAADRIVLPRPDQRPPVEPLPQTRSDEREAERGGAVARLGGVEFVQPVGAQPAVQRFIQPRAATGDWPQGFQGDRQRNGKRRIESHVFMICSFSEGVTVTAPAPTRCP